MRKTIIAFTSFLIIVCAYPATGQSAFADMGRNSRFTHLHGAVTLTSGNGVLQLDGSVGGLDDKLTYDLLVLTSACKATAPFSSTPEDIQPQAAQNKTTAQEAAKTGINIFTIKAGTGGQITGSTSKITYANAIGKGLLLVRGQDPIECSDISRP